jgi:alkanesulfonate monooxygenase SsuD/methylene tetrahydromethanopterin reductase-like flavin-dependent oxidoreductase (luciferase family)
MKPNPSLRVAPLLAVLLEPSQAIDKRLTYPAFSAPSLAAFVQALESSGAAFVLVGDSALNTRTVRSGAASYGLEAFTLASFLGVRTRSLGIVATINANYREPFAFARLAASLDHVTHGRSGWYLTHEEQGNAAANHQALPGSLAQRQAREAEFIHVIESLFDTWEEGAFIRDKASGQFIDTDRVHFLNHSGPQFSVKGPLNVAPTPQGRPVRVSDHAIGEAFDGETLGDVVLWSGRHTSPAPLEKARRGTRTRRFLKRVEPYVSDSLASALLLAEHGIKGKPGNRFIGTWDDWHAEAARLTGDGGYDGILLELPATHALDASYAQRLLQLAGAQAPDVQDSPDTLLSRLRLPRPLNRFATAEPG